jgi:hypothetical protein
MCMLIMVTLKSEREHSEGNNIIYDMIYLLTAIWFPPIGCG